ncbi:DNA topoisomerase 1 isoform X2 [Cynara cardunculus var. scolymus]|uniref:Uncharacterized protein n=1 Tax=Cynara cardunculus var. scolymus TaxID=59895 RepID=A0A103YJK3_CYNCS|nr:DNA topoisomerase 1 isoform X2 [Cynara cardunculus var. scolymus]KVI10257.1 hypothetical protein Ccrd_011360 [Cynara cardunculus var. scolymus]
MGGDRKSKKKRSPTSYSSEDEGKKKRHRSSETKSDKKEKDSQRKHKSRKSSSIKEKKPEEKHKHKHKHHKHDRRVISNFKELSDADYFLKNNEFSTWLKDERDTFFSDLSSESARKLFAEFVNDWNNKKLDSKFYDGIVTAPRSSHNWKIKVDTKGDPQRDLF